MESAGLVVAFFSMAGTIGAAVFAGFAYVNSKQAQHQSAVASEEATDATREAAKALARSAVASETSADALQQLAEIASASRPEAARPAVSWSIGYYGGDMQTATNVGKSTAFRARILNSEGIFVDEDSESDELRPGQALLYGVMPATFGSRRREITIEWRDSQDGEVQSTVATVTPNR